MQRKDFAQKCFVYEKKAVPLQPIAVKCPEFSAKQFKNHGKKGKKLAQIAKFSFRIEKILQKIN